MPLDKRALAAAIDYIPRWIEFQMRLHDQPGCAFAIAHDGKPLAELALGAADRGADEKLTPRHRFRVASHSKTFTAAAVMKLRELGLLRLDDPLGSYVGGLHPDVAAATIAQLLSHSAGLVRDGDDAGQWVDRKPFLDEAGLRADLERGPVLPVGSRFKYSNHGYGLLGLVIASVTGEPYNDWVAREIVAASGLDETTPDVALPQRTPFARGHSPKWPLGERVTIPGDNPTRALAAATGFVSTARDLTLFFSSLAPDAKKSVLSAASRREMARRQWRDPHATLERWYGLGTISGSLGDWEWFGHTGGFQGTLSRTVCLPKQGLTLSALCNAADGLPHVFVDGALHILRAFDQHGAPSRKTAAWTGRWWTLWGALDLLPTADKVFMSNPALANPLMDASQIEVSGSRQGVSSGRIALAGGFASHGEPARLHHDARGRASELWLGGTKLGTEAAAVKELRRRYVR